MAAFNLTPQATGYDPRFGGVPGALSLPDPFADLSARYPNLSGATGQASADVMAKLRGELSPGTINAIQDAAARFGVSSGMPGLMPGSLTGNRGLRNIGLTAEAQTQQGLQDYNALTQGVSNTQTVRPELQASIAEQNAVNSSAPNPAQAQTYAQSLFDKYLRQIHGGGGQARPPVRQSGGGGYTPLPTTSSTGDYVADYFSRTGAYPGAGDVQHGTNIYGSTPWQEPSGSPGHDFIAPMNPYGVSEGAVYDNGLGNSGFVSPLSQEQWVTGMGNTSLPWEYDNSAYA